MEFYINLEEIINLEGLVHVYAFDLKGRLLVCNELQSQTLEEMLDTNR